MGATFAHGRPKRVRLNISNGLLAQFRRNKTEFWRRLITVDETWIHHYTPGTKIQSEQWTVKGNPASKKAKTLFSAGKVMATVFWDSHGVVLIDYFLKGKCRSGNFKMMKSRVILLPNNLENSPRIA